MIVVASGLAAMVVAYRSRVPMVDDVGITARYAARIADGHGWTYNDGDRTNGASAPLYTMLLAAAHVVGIDVLVAARAIGVACAAACAALVAHVAGRITGWMGAAAGAALLIAWPFWQVQATGGMESALAAALGLAVIAALADDREALAGVLLGLALLNKLDAGMLAAAVALGVVVVRRRPPWLLAGLSAAVLAPWLLFSVVYFGSPLPNSFTAKAGGDVVNPAHVHDPRWIIDYLWESGPGLLVPVGIAALVLVPALRRHRPAAAVAVVATVAWPVLHGLVFSVLDMGDAYPWYLAVLCPPMALAAGLVLGELAHRATTPRGLGIAVALAIVVQVLGLPGPLNANPLRTTAKRVVNGSTLAQSDAFELARRDAGEFVGRIAEPGDVVATCFGWIAYGALETTIDETCPLNTRDEVGPVRWVVLVTYPGTDPTTPPEGSELVQSFVSEVGEGGRVDVYRLPVAG